MRKILPLPSSSLSSTPSSSSSHPRRPSTSSSSLVSLPSSSSTSSSRGIRFPPHSLPPPSSSSFSSRKKSPKQKAKEIEEAKLPALIQPPVLLLENYKIFWRIHKTALISIYYHSDSDFFEVITFFTEEEYEGLRLYVSMKSILPILENTSEMRLVKLLRWDLLDRSMRKCAAEYLFGILDSDADATLRLTRYDGRENILLDLQAPLPSTMVPMIVERNPSISQTEIFDEITLISHEIPTITQTATELVVSTDTQWNTISTLDRRFKTEANVNPNLHSAARWRWIWGIDKVLISLRIQKVVHAIWRSANKGRLVYQTMTLDRLKGISNGRSPFLPSFRRYSTAISSRLSESTQPTPAEIQPPISVFQEMISSFEDAKQKAKERRKSKVIIPSLSSP